MKKIQIYIYAFFIIFMLGFHSSYASIDKNNGASQARESHTEHPPHDHHDTDHIKKLDEGIRRKRKDEKISH